MKQKYEELGQSVEVDMENIEGNIEFPFKVTVTNNDTIIIENNTN